MKRFKKVIGFVLATTVAISMVGCSTKGTDKNVETPKDSGSTTQVETKGTKYPITLTDSNNKTITIDKEPMKVVSVGPNITETIYAIGMGNKLVGRTDYCDYPEEAKKVQSIGTLKTPSIEKIAELKPDVVIASTHFKPEVEKKLEEVGIKVVVLYGEDSFDGVYKIIEDTGKLLNAPENASKVVSNMKEKVNYVQEKVKGKEKLTTYYVVGYGKDQFTAGGDTFIGKMIEMAGGKNVADDVKGWSYSLEKLVEKNPQIIVCSKYKDSKKGIQATNGYKDLKAIKEDKLFEIDNNMLDRQGPRLADGLVELAKIIHPESFK